MISRRLVVTKLLPIISCFLFATVLSEELEDDIFTVIGVDDRFHPSFAEYSPLRRLLDEDVFVSKVLLADQVERQQIRKDERLMLLYSALDDLVYEGGGQLEDDNDDLQDLVSRDAKRSAAKSAAASKPAPAPKVAAVAKAKQPQQSKADKQKAGNEKKAQENTAMADKKAKDQTAKADKTAKTQAVKAEKQKQKDTKLVKDNLVLEKKAQDKAGATAQKNLDNIQKKTVKDTANENKKYAGQERKLQQNLAKSEKVFASQKGKKGEGQASKSLAQTKAAMASEPIQHKAKVNKLYQKSMTAIDKNRGSLDKSLTKAHTAQFDANGRAKEHPSTLQKFGKVMSYLGPAMLSFIPGAGAAVMGAMTAGRVAGAVAQTATKEGVKQGAKQGTKKGVKQAAGKSAATDWRKAQPEHLKTSQLNKDSHIGSYEAKRAQFAKTLRPVKRDVEVYHRLTSPWLYDLAWNGLVDDHLIWDGFVDEDDDDYRDDG